MIRGFKKNDTQKGSGKKKLVLAKDPKQLAIAVVVIAIFVLKTSYDLIAYFYSQSQHDDSKITTSSQVANNQQKNLESLSDNTSGQQAPPPAQENVQADANDIYSQTLSMQGNSAPPPPPPQAVAGQAPNLPENEVDVISKSKARPKNYKMTTIQVTDSGRSNPFLPAGENTSVSSLPGINLVSPPDQISSNTDAEKVLGTTISGILYDKYSPSAIINIAGTDYLVKKGDVINKYRVLSIAKEQVVVQLGHNVYKAGVGQLLEQSKVNYNIISNLDKKFGGNEIPIGVKKKKY